MKRRKKVRSNPLAVTMSIRDFKPAQYWIEQIDFIDRLYIKNYVGNEPYQIAKKYFMENPQYSHFFFLSEDTIATSSMVKLIMEDTVAFPKEVICGYSNVDYTHDDSNISFRNMKNLVVRGREVYQHPKLTDLWTGKYGFPYVKVWFMGTTLALIPRAIVEKLSFKSYIDMDGRYVERVFGFKHQHGIMQDFQMCKELDALGIANICDLRAYVPHMVGGFSSLNMKGKARTVTLHRKDGKIEKIREDEPYFR
jgi:hypothetical protein